jgi:hypothetical protein
MRAREKFPKANRAKMRRCIYKRCSRNSFSTAPHKKINRSREPHAGSITSRQQVPQGVHQPKHLAGNVSGTETFSR